LTSGPSARLRPIAVVVLVAAAIAIAGCGGDGDGESADSAPQADGVGEVVRANSTVQFANCRDWRRGSEDERYATIAGIRGQLTPQGSETAASALPDSVAYEIFDKTCADGSGSLRLYKLYAPAQAFAPLRTDVDDGDE
jgi:hypothetical protein